MDWNKASGLSGIGNFIVGAIMLGILAWPMVHPQSPTMPPAVAAGRQASDGEAQPTSERAMNPQWWPPIILGMCLLAAAGLHVKAASLGRRAASQGAQPEVRPSSDLGDIREVQILNDGRIFLDKTAFELTEPFKTYTDIRAERVVSDYLGKWVRWTVEVDNIWESGDKIVHATSEIYPPGDRTTVLWKSVSVPIAFERLSSQKVRHEDRNVHMTVEDKIENIQRKQVNLVDCRLLGLTKNPPSI
jgi:hypothetical protein